MNIQNPGRKIHQMPKMEHDTKNSLKLTKRKQNQFTKLFTLKITQI